MQKNSRFFEDIARLATSAGGTLVEMKNELDARVQTQVDKVLRRMDLVTREDFNVVRDMAAKARAEQEQLLKRIEALEAKQGVDQDAVKPGKGKK